MIRIRLIFLYVLFYPFLWAQCAFIGRRARGYWPSVRRNTAVLHVCFIKIWRENTL